MGIVALAAAAALVAWGWERARGASWRVAVPLAARCGLAFLLGFLPWLATFAVDAAREHGVRSTLGLALGGDFQRVMFTESPGHALLDLVFLVGVQFPSPFLAFVVVGPILLVREWRDVKSLLALSVLFVVNTVFFAFYATWDKFAFLLPSFLVLALAAAFALAPLDRWLDGRPPLLRWGVVATLLAAFVVPPPAVYARLPAWGEDGGIFARYAPKDAANILDVGTYLANPDRRGFRGFEEFIELLFSRLPPGATYLDDDSRTYYPIKYVQRYEGGRPDVRVELVNVWGFENWGLDPPRFADLLRTAHARDLDLFLPSLETPYLPWLLRPENVDRYRFRRFPLDERRYVFRLVTSADETRLAPEGLRDVVLVVGQRAGATGTVVRTDFSAWDTISGELRFSRNGEPTVFRLEWTAPGGERWTGDEVRIPFGCVVAWSVLDAPRPLPPGVWTVEARSGATRLAEARFIVRPATSGGAGRGSVPSPEPR
jgi:hypothetical protein